MVTVQQVSRQGMRARHEFFYRPTSVKQVHGNRGVMRTDLSLIEEVDDAGHITTTRVSVLEALAQCAQDPEHRAVLIQGPILPDEYLVPREIWEKPLEPWRRFLKYAPEVNLRAPRFLRQAVDQQASPLKLRRERFAQLDPAEAYGSLTWWGIRAHIKHRTHLVDVLEGTKLFVFSELASRDSPHRINVEPCIDVKAAARQGGIYLVEVPSRSRSLSYPFRLEAVPLADAGDQRYGIWTDLRVKNHDCEENRYDFGYKYVAGEVVFCAHALAAYLAIAKTERSRGFISTPVPLVSRFFVEDVYNLLRSRTLVEEETIVNGRTRKDKRRLNKAEMELLLWKAVSFYGHDKTCYARPQQDGKIQDYTWQLR